MSIASKTKYVCSVDADISYISFEWSLTHWSILYEYYRRGFDSPKFEIMQTNKCMCSFSSTANDPLTSNIMLQPYVANQTTVNITFLDDFELNILQAKIYIVGKNMRKLCAVKSAHTEVPKSGLELCFKESLTNEVAAQYLVDDTLKLLFELSLVTTIANSPVRKNTLDLNPSSMAKDKLGDIFKSGELCDITFIVQGQSLTAHKLVLASNSDVFREMFTSEMKDKENGTIEIDDVDAKVFQSFLNFMYTRKVEEINELAVDLIIVATRYQVIDLVQVCETYMKSHINVENAVKYLLIAHQLHSKILEKAAIDFIKCNTKVLGNTAAFKSLSDYPNLIRQIFDETIRCEDDSYHMM